MYTKEKEISSTLRSNKTKLNISFSKSNFSINKANFSFSFHLSCNLKYATLYRMCLLWIFFINQIYYQQIWHCMNTLSLSLTPMTMTPTIATHGGHATAKRILAFVCLILTNFMATFVSLFTLRDCHILEWHLCAICIFLQSFFFFGFYYFSHSLIVSVSRAPDLTAHHHTSFCVHSTQLFEDTLWH